MTTAIEFVKHFKSFVDADDLSGAKHYFEFIRSEDIDLPWDYMFQKVYLHACLKKRKDFVDWMNTLFEELSTIEKVALRQMFSYGRYLLTKK